MRICYWSSDVCASDLQVGGGAAPDARQDVVELDQREIVDRPAEEPERQADAADHERHRKAGEQPERQRHEHVDGEIVLPIELHGSAPPPDLGVIVMT